MIRSRNLNHTLDLLDSQFQFIDHAGQHIERLDDEGVIIGPGYNNTLAAVDYGDALADGQTYGHYVVPGLSRDAWGYYVQ